MKVVIIHFGKPYSNIKHAICIYKSYHNHFIRFIHNGKTHNPKFHAAYMVDRTTKLVVDKYYFYNGNLFFTSKKKFFQKNVKQLKKYQKLKIFK